MRFLNNNQAFSLVEITVVIVIVSVLASLAYPRYASVMEKSRSAEGITALEALRKAQWAYYYENNSTFTSTLADLDISIPAMDGFNNPVVSAAATALASVTRIGGAYTIRIADDGNLTCTCATNICTKMGL